MEMLCAGTIASIMTSSCLCMKKVILEVMCGQLALLSSCMIILESGDGEKRVWEVVDMSLLNCYFIYSGLRCSRGNSPPSTKTNPRTIGPAIYTETNKL